MSEVALTRLKIWVFTSATFSRTVGDKPFEVQVNPESFSIAYNIQYGGNQPKGTSNFDPKWEKNPPRKLSFEILFDSTGAIQGPQKRVSAQINELDNMLFKAQGKGHRPNYLQIEWGTLVFNCCLDNMTITYKLFAPDGEPLRASINASFSEVVRRELYLRDLNASSPDVTHALTVKGDESLPMMTEKVYGSSSHYIAVAQANKLVHFRNLKAGGIILFPPIKDQHG